MAYEKLKQAIQHLAYLNPDFTALKNGVGFNSFDCRFGMFLASVSEWKEVWAKKAHQMLQKYKNTQLLPAGIEIDEYFTPEGSEQKKMSINDLKFEFTTINPTFEHIQKLSKYVASIPINRFSDPQSFWALWKENKEAIKRSGFGVSQWQGEWKISFWNSKPDYNIVPITIQATIDAAIEQKQAIETKIEETIVNVDLSSTVLYEYQKPHVMNLMRILSKYNYALDASDMGTGKTVTTLVTCKMLGLNPIVICPKPVIHGWFRNAQLVGINIKCIANYELAKLGKEITITPKKKMKGVASKVFEVIPNPVQNKYEPKNIVKFNVKQSDIVIFDEAHRGKNPKTQNSALLVQAKNQKAKILLLSGTIGESPLKMYGTGRVLELWEQPWEFYTKFCAHYGCVKEQVSRTASAWRFNGGNETMRELHDHLKPVLSRMDKEDLRAKGLFPNTQIIDDPFFMEVASKIDAVFEELERNLHEIREKKEEYEHRGGQGAALAVQQKALQEIELLKLSTIKELVEDAIDNGNSVSVFLNYTDSIERLSEMLETDCKIYGSNTSEKNESNRLRFENNESRIIICNVAAAKEGIDLHDKYHKFHRVAFISPNYNAQSQAQVLGRVDRAGGSDSMQYIVYCADSIEEKVRNAVAGKIDNINSLNGMMLFSDLLVHQ